MQNTLSVAGCFGVDKSSLGAVNHDNRSEHISLSDERPCAAYPSGKFNMLKELLRGSSTALCLSIAILPVIYE